MSADHLNAICITRLELLQLLLSLHTNHQMLLTTLPHVGWCMLSVCVVVHVVYLCGCAYCQSVWSCRSESLEAQLKSLLYYFRHHTVEPQILKRLCFVEIVYMLQNHANRYGTVPVVIYPMSC